MDKEYTNSRIEFLIDEYIHNKRNRKILKMHFIDGDSVMTISKDKAVDLTDRRVSQIIEECSAQLAKYL